VAPYGQGLVKRYIRFNGLRRGVLGGSRFWTALFVASHAGRWASKVAKRGPMPVVTSDALAPGEGLVIRHIAPGED
jgi:hypothetical protein